MEVVNLMFALIGHVLASVLYVIRRLRFPPPSQKAIVDRSSILEHKEEIKQLWEKKMMESEQQASVAGESATKEEEEEVKVATLQHSETNGHAPKMANGTVPVQSDDVAPPDAQEPEKKQDDEQRSLLPDSNKTDESKLSKLIVAENDESAEVEPLIHETNVQSSSKTICEEKILKVEAVEVSSESEIVEIEEKVYTSTLQQTFVVTKEEQSAVVVEERTTKVTEVIDAKSDTQEDFEEIERRIQAEESQNQMPEKEEETVEKNSVEQIESKEEVIVTKEVEIKETEQEVKEEEEEDNSYLSEQVDSADSLEENEPHAKGDEFNEAVVLENRANENEKEILLNGVSDDDYRPLGEFLPPRQGDNIEEDIATAETAFTQNGETEEKTFDDHFVLDTHEIASPVSDTEQKDTSSKKSRGQTTGVQKTEQPYSTCTTETKIAMEIREMREREEELKIMRERQAQISPVPPPQKSPTATKAPVAAVQKPTPSVGYVTPNSSKISTPGYRVSSVFGHRAVSQQPNKDEGKLNRNFNKESPVEREIRLAKDREEELRKQKGLPPREDDSYVKPSQVKSSQAKVFGKMNNTETSRLLATAKIQHEIEEQNMREMALRESGHIQTLSTERTDSKVTKLKALELQPECVSPTFQNGTSPVHTNGNFSNGHISPDQGSKRSTPSPTGSNYSPTSRNVLPPANKGISMQKFIASRGKETTFAAPRNGPFNARPDYLDTSRSLPEPGKLKRTVSVESKIQQEIMEMKLREEELKKLHSGPPEKTAENGDTYDDALPRSPSDYPNGQSEGENPCPRRNNLIAQWEQMIQNAEGKA